MLLKLLFLSAIFNIALLSSEPSAFGAGDINSKNPYGLSRTETLLVKNKIKIKNLEKKNYKLKKSVENLEERLFGLQSVLESFTTELSEQKKIINSIDKKMVILDIDYNRMNEQIDSTKDGIKSNNVFISELRKDYNESLANSNALFEQLAKLINSININYATQENVKILNTELIKLKKIVMKEFQKLNKKDTNDYFRTKSGFALFKEAKALYSKKRYQEAIPYFNYLIKIKYKQSTHNFYLGECYYYLRQYKNAIASYTISYNLFSKADRVSKLLYHTAYSFEKLGKKGQAKAFYQSVLDEYPKSSESALAKKRLKKLN
jgi:TolA-binding protein